jgi:UDP-glucose 4-epimerase
MGDLADALGWYSIPLPELGAAAAAELTARLPFMPPEAAWLQAFRVPVLMDTAKAKRELSWRPKYTSRDTLDWMVAAAREEQRY